METDNLPIGWHWEELGNICKQDRQVVESQSTLASRLLYLSLEHIESNSGRILREPSEPIQDEGRSLTYHFDNQHVLYGKLRPYLNKVALPDFEGRCTTELIPLLPIDIDREFLAWVLRRKETVDAAMQEKTGSRMPRANMDNLFALEIPLPPLDEQRRIAKRLNEQMAAVESARKAAEEQLQAARELLPAYLRGVFESQEAKEWKVFRLGDVGEIVGGVQRTPNRAPTKFHKPYLTVRNVKQGYLDLTQIERFEVTPNEFERCRLHVGDILIVEGNGSIDQIGRNALFDLDETEWIHQNHIIRVRLPQQTFDSKFVSLFLNSHLGRLQMVEKAMTTSGLYTLSSGKVASLEIPSPSLDKQQEIVRNLENKVVEINKIQSSLESQLAEINRLPASLLREGFAGGI